MKKSPAVAGYVYAIHAPETPNHVKLGLSSNPQARLRQLQTGNPHKLALIWHFPCDNMAQLEDVFHKAFDRYRIPCGEWFDFHPIDDPEYLATWLMLLSYKYLTPRRQMGPELRKTLANLEGFIDDPARFLTLQPTMDAMVARYLQDAA